MEIARYLGQMISEEKTELSLKISRSLDERYISFLKESRLEDEAIVQWRAQFIDYIGKALMAFDTIAVLEEVSDWAKQTGEGAVNVGVGIDELLETNKLYRKVIWEYIQINIDTEKTSVKSFLKINEIIDTILDHTAHTFSVSYVKYHKRTLKLAHEAILEISTPVVSISDKMAILPLIGEIDTNRAQILMESALTRCTELKSSELIIDLSGVPEVNTMVAHELYKLAKALKLIGVQTIFTGIRPETAQAMINLGISFLDFQTMGTLKQALMTKGII